MMVSPLFVKTGVGKTPAPMLGPFVLSNALRYCRLPGLHQPLFFNCYPPSFLGVFFKMYCPFRPVFCPVAIVPQVIYMRFDKTDPFIAVISTDLFDTDLKVWVCVCYPVLQCLRFH